MKRKQRRKAGKTSNHHGLASSYTPGKLLAPLHHRGKVSLSKEEMAVGSSLSQSPDGSAGATGFDCERQKNRLKDKLSEPLPPLTGKLNDGGTVRREAQILHSDGNLNLAAIQSH